MKKIGLALISFLLFQNILLAQEGQFEKLDSLFTILESNNRWMGSFSMSHDGTTVYEKSLGFADTENQQKADNHTKYRVGSITKIFTSTLTFMAIEEGLLPLDRTIETFFPEIENAGKITIGHLLSHRSGIFNFTSSEDYLEWHTEPKSRKELVHLISEKESTFEPNSKAEYSNSNYILLTFILEDVFKTSYTDLVDTKIVQPLKLGRTQIGKHIKTSENEALSYRFTDSWIEEKETDMSIPLGAGALISTPTDLNRFITALFSEKLIGKESLNTMKTISDGYGMGIFQMPFYDKKGYGHNGGIDGFTSMLGYLPEDKLAFSLTSNGSRVNNNDIMVAALSAYFDKPFDLPSFKSFVVQPEALALYVGTYSSEQTPLKITITQSENGLMAQATGQPSFLLEAVEKDVFEFNQAGVRMEFEPSSKSMVLKQGGATYNYEIE
ncbi:MAG: peptidase [Pseudozobellia sp.]|nr:peptidase [Pseudozobellia sp.]|tara:strand:+ start:4966 stop:6285 length:1320 start_codon:yes stop_codon:yes gene_type:complete